MDFREFLVLYHSISFTFARRRSEFTWNIGIRSTVEKQLNNVCGSLFGGHFDGGSAELVPAAAIWHVVEFISGVQQQSRYLQLFRVHFLPSHTAGYRGSTVIYRYRQGSTRSHDVRLSSVQLVLIHKYGKFLNKNSAILSQLCS